MNKQRPLQILVFRLSAIGDVAMTVPVLWSLKQHYPELEVTFVSRGFAKSFIEKIPNVRFFEFEPDKKHKGFLGIIKLFIDLRKLGRYDYIADLHDVLRTKLIRFLFRLSGAKVSKIDKGRAEKRRLTRLSNKTLIPLKSTFERYHDVFQRNGFNFSFSFESFFKEPEFLSKQILNFTGKKEGKWLGIAPFAKHPGKSYPADKLMEVIRNLSERSDLKVFLFGGGKAEVEALDQITKDLKNVISLAGKLNFGQELQVMSNLDLMISMDSANMHLASLSGVPVISIWGATHPFAGFYGWKQDPDNAIQVDLHCRPCSVFGDLPCFRKDYACLNLLEPGIIIEKVIHIIEKV